jgi:small-conductance mechanosensitive channel
VADAFEPGSQNRGQRSASAAAPTRHLSMEEPRRAAYNRSRSRTNPMWVRLRLFSVLALLAFGGCRSADDAARRESASEPGSRPTAPAEPAQPVAAETSGENPSSSNAGDTPQSPSGSGASLEEHIERLIAGQEGIARRLDSLAATPAAMESGGGAPDGEARQDRAGPTSEEVLGQARASARGFGVGVAWSVLAIVLFNYLIASLVWLLDTLAERSPDRRLFYKRLAPIVRILLWLFAAYLIVAVIFDVEAQNLIAATAAFSVAVGFAAQDLLKNLFGGMILVFDQPFQVGDKISVGGTYGEVVSIGLRSTRIVTPDDNLVSVPNAQVVDQQVANANAGELNCQVVTDLYLPGWADEETAKRIAFNAAISSKFVYLRKPVVVLVADVFEETFLTRVRVKAYVLDPRLEFQFQSDVTERARAGFREAGLLNVEHMQAHLRLHPPATGS